jgi:cobalamin synthase
MSDVAAPLLGAAAVTVASVILQAPGSFRLPDWAVLSLVIAASCFVFTVQAMLHARNAMNEGSEEGQERWITRARRSYNVAVFTFWVGVAVSLTPSDGSPVRWVAVAVAAAAALLEVAWMLAPSLT